MKLKLVMSDAETGEVLHEATDLNFAMMCFAKEDSEGLDYESKITTNRISAYGYAKCLEQVRHSTLKAVAEAPKIVQDITEMLSKESLVEMANVLLKGAKNAAAEKKEETSE